MLTNKTWLLITKKTNKKNKKNKKKEGQTGVELTSTVVHDHKSMEFAATASQACNLDFHSEHIHQMSSQKM